VKNKDLEKLLNTFKKGSEQAFDRLYEETKIPVYYTILSIVKDESLAEDLMQDTYIKMINQLDKYQKKGQFLAWLKTIARNTALNEYNKRKKESTCQAPFSELQLLLRIGWTSLCLIQCSLLES
jgi:RNA polymerase sigma-70 factor (ECF subfamily)